MLSSMKSVHTPSNFLASIQQSLQDWIRREIIDDDPYDVLSAEELANILSSNVEPSTNAA